MTVKAVLLVGVAAFGAAMFAAGELFEEPAGRSRLDRPRTEAVEPSLEWELWEVPGPPAADDPAATPDPIGEAGELPPAGNASEAGVWATPALWSDSE